MSLRTFHVTIACSDPEDDYDLIGGLEALASSVVDTSTDNAIVSIEVTEDRDMIFSSYAGGDPT